MPKKEIINISIDKKLRNYMDSHFNLPGLKLNRSQFIESCIRAKIEGTIKPEDQLKNEIKFHEGERKFHDDILAELYIKQKRMKGELKMIPTETLSELRKKSEKEKDIEDIIGPVPNHPGPVPVLTQNMSRKEIKAKASKIING